MTGVALPNMSAWRDKVTEALQKVGIDTLNPVRDFDILHVGADKVFFTRDFEDVKRCNCVLANLLPADRVSIGTMFEIAWAFCLGKPIIVVMNKPDLIHNHPFVRTAATAIVRNLHQAIETTTIMVSDSVTTGAH